MSRPRIRRNGSRSHSDDYDSRYDTAQAPDERGVYSTVVTYGAPSGAQMAICGACERRFTAAGRWPKDFRGDELATVSHGAHKGVCQAPGHKTAKNPTRRNSGGFKVLITGPGGEHAGVLGPYYGPKAEQHARDDADAFRKQAKGGVAVKVVPMGRRSGANESCTCGGGSEWRREARANPMDELARAVGNPFLPSSSVAGYVVTQPYPSRGGTPPQIGNPRGSRGPNERTLLRYSNADLRRVLGQALKSKLSRYSSTTFFWRRRADGTELVMRLNGEDYTLLSAADVASGSTLSTATRAAEDYIAQAPMPVPNRGRRGRGGR